MGPIRGRNRKDRTRVNMELVESKELPAKISSKGDKSKNKRKKERRRDKCKRCEVEDFVKAEREFCAKCKSFLSQSKSVKCHLCEKRHYRNKHSEGCGKCSEKNSTLGSELSSTTSTSTTSTTTTISQETSTTQPSSVLRKNCRNPIFRKSNRAVCKQALDKCRNRMYRTGNPTKCEEEEGDKEWLLKKCSTKNFIDKNKDTCKQLCKEEDFRQGNIDICDNQKSDLDKNGKERKGHTKKKEHAHFESLEELVKKCDNKGYKKRNGDKCKVVETIDLVLVEDSKKQNVKHDLTVSNVKILDGQIPIKNDLNSKIEQEIAEEAIEETQYDDPSIQKEDIVNSIKSKTKKDMNKVPVPIESIDEPADNDIDTYESSDIVSSEKLKKKKDKKKKDSKSKKKKGGELKEEKQKKKKKS